MRNFAFGLLALLIIGVATAQEKNDPTTLTKVGQAVPNFTIQTLDGKTLAPDSLKGKVVLLSFFATWCGPCIEEMPEFQKVFERFKDKPFVMVAIARGQTPQDIKPFIEEKKLTFPFAADPNKDAWSLFATDGIPRNYVIDAAGKIVFQSDSRKLDDFAQVNQSIEQALAEAVRK